VTTLIKTPGKAPAATKTKAADTERVNILRLLEEPGGVTKVAQKLSEARQRDPKATLFSEAIVNAIGYEHIQSGDPKGAAEFFTLNVMAYPDSANVYDSLSDAYLAEGRNDLAKKYAQKALETLPADTTVDEDRKKLIRDSAEQKLKQLAEKP
jgi:tetratricopeptide (TPR) repeat protein